MKFRILLNIIFLVSFSSSLMCYSQDSTIKDSLADLNILQREIIDGDTIFVTNLKEVFVYPPLEFDNWWKKRKYRRLVKNLKKVHPYSVLAGNMLQELNSEMLDLENEREQKQFLKSLEDSIRNEYEDELKKLTITQGRLLIKLIDRETGSTSYDLVKELRGTFSAVFWQTLARIFGSNLKTEYDPQGEDWLIEEIVVRIESGQI
jgi:hypothetical protein